MHKKTILAIIPILFLLAGCGKTNVSQNISSGNTKNLDVQNSKNQKSQQDLSNKDNASGSGEEIIKGNMKSLLAAGKAMVCTYKISNDNKAVIGDGTMYFNSGGKKLKSESVMSDVNSSVTSVDIIFDFEGQMLYSWTKIPEIGVVGTNQKLASMEEYEKMASTLPKPDQKKSEDLLKQNDYKCKPWIVDNSKFTPPSDVKFTDLGEEFLKNIKIPSDIPTK